jgi:potassium efflux system protein
MPSLTWQHLYFVKVVRVFGVVLILLTSFPSLSQEPSNPEESRSEKGPAETSKPAVQPEIEADASEPLTTVLPSASPAGIRQQIQTLRDSLDQRLAALASSKDQLTYADSVLSRLNDEYESFELRLEKAGLNLTEEYARLLRQRLERLEEQSIANSLITGIGERLSSAREEQLRLEEIEAVLGNSDETRDQLRRHRASLIRQLHEATTQHIDVLNEYFNIVEALQARILAYKTLLQQRLFWLPSAQTIGLNTADKLAQSVAWFAKPAHWDTLPAAVVASFVERTTQTVIVLGVLLLILVRRRAILARLVASGEPVGNVGQDKFQVTLAALVSSVLMTLPAVLVLALSS